MAGRVYGFSKIAAQVVGLVRKHAAEFVKQVLASRGIRDHQVFAQIYLVVCKTVVRRPHLRKLDGKVCHLFAETNKRSGEKKKDPESIEELCGCWH